MISARPVLSAKHYALLTAAFLLFVIYGSLVPFQVRSIALDTAWTQFTAVVQQGLTLRSRSDWAANVLLFIPLGFLATGAVNVDRRRRLAILAVVPAMTALSAALEFAQLWFRHRHSSLDDVVAETIGGIVGVASWLLFGQRLTDKLRAAWTHMGANWAARILPVWLVALVIVHGMPFDLTLSPWQIRAKYLGGQQPTSDADVPRIALVPPAGEAAANALLTIACFAPIGALLSRLPGRRWQSGGRVLAFGIIVALAIEVLQLLVVSRGTYASDVLVGGFSVLAGWWVVRRLWPVDRGDGP